MPAAILALVLLSALVAGALFVSTEELRSGRSDMIDQRALAAAEWALDRAILDWDVQRNSALSVGATAVVSDRAPLPNDRVTVTATRVQRYAIWMTAASTAGGDGRSIPARHVVAASLRLVAPAVPSRAALTTAGSVTVDGGVVDGRDATPGDDTTALCADRQPAAGISIPDPSLVTCITCSIASQFGVFGSPPIDSGGAVDSSLSRVGDASLDTLANRATIALDGGTFAPRPSIDSGVCNRADALNWGDPGGSGACASWYPVIYIRGGAVLAPGSVGQGILVVRGRLRVEANARFVGVVMATEGIDVVGVGAAIDGAAIAGSVGAGGSRVSAGGAIRLAACSVRRAMLGAARLERTRVRWWAELR